MTNHDRHPRNRKITRGGALRDRGAVRPNAALIFFGLIAAVAILAVLAMYVLAVVGGTTGQWERRSYIAQSLETPVTILTVLLIAGGVVALWQTAREQRAAAERATFAQRRELTKAETDHPHLRAVWGGPADPRLADDDPDALDHANEIMDYWRIAYHGGVTNDAEVRLGARRFFTGRIGRAYWKAARADRLATARDGIERRFYRFVDAEYTAALADPPAPDEPLEPSPFAAASPGLVRGGVGHAGAARSMVAATAAGLLLGSAAGFLVGRRTAEPVRSRWRGR